MNHLNMSTGVLLAILSAAFLSVAFQTDRELRRGGLSASRRENIKKEMWGATGVSLVFGALAILFVNFAL